MIRKAGPADAANLEAFLVRYAATSMFLRGNLAQHGTQEVTHPHGTTFWISEDRRGICGVAGCTNRGYLMCQAPQADAAFWQDVCTHLAGRDVAGMTGDPDQTAAWIAALGLEETQFGLNQITPLYQVATCDVAAPEGAPVLRRPMEADVPWLAPWFDGFFEDTGLGLPSGMTPRLAAEGFVAKADTRLLVAAGAPVAMTAINARAVDTVQVGGVYVPPDQRSKGYGGTVVALHLAELAQEGVARAVLFAANKAAARAYERIGFQHVGAYRVAMLNAPVVVGKLPGA